MNRSFLATMWVFGVLGMVNACSPMEPLGVLRGSLTGEVPTTEDTLHVVLAWYDTRGGTTIVENTEVTGELPAAFTLEVYAPPFGAYETTDVYVGAGGGRSEAGGYGAHLDSPTGTQID